MAELIIKNYINGGDQDTIFHDPYNPIELKDYTCDIVLMGQSTISATFNHPEIIDDWDGTQYVVFQNERYFIKNIPSTQKSNTSTLYKYKLEFLSEKDIRLGGTYFVDIVSTDTATPINKYHSNNTNVIFFGDLDEFIDRLNLISQSKNLGYEFIKDPGIETSPQLISFKDKYISEALKEAYNIFKIPYFYEKITEDNIIHSYIHFGETNNIIEEPFRYGAHDQLLTIKKDNANKKIIRRITGIGSEDNIPYYYPNISPKGNIKATVIPCTDSTLSNNDVKIINYDKFSSRLKIYPTEVNYGLIYTEISQTHLDYSPTQLTLLAQDDEWGLAGDTAYTNATDIITLLPNTAHCPDSNYILHITKNIPEGDCGQIVLKLRLKYTEYEKHLSIPGGPIIEPGHGEPYWDENNPADILDIQFSSIGWNVTTNQKFHTLKKDDESYNYWTIIYKSEEAFAGAVLEFNITLLNTDLKHLRNIDVSIESSPTWVNAPTAILSPDRYKVYNIANLYDYGLKITDISKVKVGDQIVQQYIDAAHPKIPYSAYLMPPIYRETSGEEKFYDAANNTYTLNESTTEYYQFTNFPTAIIKDEYIKNCEKIKPTIVGIKNAGRREINRIKDIAFDTYDNDICDEKTGKYEHSYFYIQLEKFNGEYGFNLFDSASEKGEMTISMTSGNCGGCKFLIGVDYDNKNRPFNPVQVNDDGTLKRDDNGNVIRRGKAIPRQNDTSIYNVWIAVKKEISTFGIVMPNATNNYKPQIGDSFVILNILLPPAYIYNAENKLKYDILDTMQEDNVDKFNFSITLSSIYLALNPIVKEQIKENTQLTIEYENEEYTFHILSYKYTIKPNTYLPTISISLSKEATPYSTPFQGYAHQWNQSQKAWKNTEQKLQKQQQLSETRATSPSKGIELQNLVIINEQGKYTYDGSEAVTIDFTVIGSNYAKKIHNHAGQLIRPKTLVIPTGYSLPTGATLNNGETALYTGDIGFDASSPSASSGTNVVWQNNAANGYRILNVGGDDENVALEGHTHSWSAITGRPSQATNSVLGLVKTGYSRTGKNYPVELNDTGQMFVNVPWTDTNTTNVTITNGEAESGKYISALSASGGAITVTKATLPNNTTYTFTSGNGSFVVTPSDGTAQTVSIGKPATAGTADNSLKLGNKEEYELNVLSALSATNVNWSGITNTPTTLTGYGITDVYTKSEVDNKLVSIYKVKGSKDNFAQIQALTNPVKGDVWNALDTGANYVWTGTEWDNLGGTVDLSSYYTKSQADGKFVTLDTAQTIRGQKTFTEKVYLSSHGLDIGNVVIYNEGGLDQLTIEAIDINLTADVYLVKALPSTLILPRSIPLISANEVALYINNTGFDAVVPNDGGTNVVWGNVTSTQGTLIVDTESHTVLFPDALDEYCKIEDAYPKASGEANASHISTLETYFTHGVANNALKLGGVEASSYVVDTDYVHTDKNFTEVLLTKLNGIATGAEVNVQSDWNITTTTSDAFIKNKPTALKNPYTLSWSGYSNGSYDGSATKTINIPNNTNQLTNGAGFISGIDKGMVEAVLTGNITSHTHSYLPLSGGIVTGDVKVKTLTITSLEPIAHLKFNLSAHNYISVPTNGKFTFVCNDDVSLENATIVIDSVSVCPHTTNTISLGKITERWQTVYSQSYFGDSATFNSMLKMGHLFLPTDTHGFSDIELYTGTTGFDASSPSASSGTNVLWGDEVNGFRILNVDGTVENVALEGHTHLYSSLDGLPILPGKATENVLGLVKIGYPASGKNYAVQLDSAGNMFVNVPWTDTNTTNVTITNGEAESGKYISALSASGGAITVTKATLPNNITYTFTSGNGSFVVTPSDGTAQTVSIGKPATAGTADIANQLGTATVGSSTVPIYLSNGIPTPCDFSSSTFVTISGGHQTIEGAKTFTNKIDFIGTLTLPVSTPSISANEVAFYINDVGFDATNPSTSGTDVVWGNKENNFRILNVDNIKENVALLGHTHSWEDITGSPALADYYTKSEANSKFATLTSLDDYYTITAADGKFVTLETAQTIKGQKIFRSIVKFTSDFGGEIDVGNVNIYNEGTSDQLTIDATDIDLVANVHLTKALPSTLILSQSNPSIDTNEVALFVGTTGFDGVTGTSVVQDKGTSTTDVMSQKACTDIFALKTALNTYQKKTDASLNTTAKTIVGAINELFNQMVVHGWTTLPH